ncbi:MAG: translocation/assembly module TamB domain-containing protein, partial [Cyanobacteria bacterium P01_D01_bin.128]
GNTVIDRVTLADLNLDFSFVDSRLVFDRFSLFPQAGGSLTGQGTFSLGESPSLFLQAEGRDLPANAIGRAYGLPETITLGNVAVDAEVSGPLNNLRGLVNWQAPQGDYPARGEIALSGQQIDFRNTVVQVAGGLVRGEGTLVNGLWNARLNAEGIQLGEFVDRLQGSTGQAAAALSGSLDDLSLRGIRGDGTLSAQVAGGTVSGTATLANGNWLTDLQTAGILLSAFNPQLQGRASGDVQLSGSLSDLSLAGIRGSGNIALSQGLASFAGFSPQLERVNSPLTAAIAWDGRQVQVQQATSAGFSANGVLVPRLEGPGAPTLANLDLNLILRDYDLAALPGPPDGLMLAGRADFTGRLRGSLSNLALNGDAALTNLALNDLTFEERLSGPVTFAAGDRLAVDLTGDRDRLQVSYGFGTNNIAFDVRTAAQTAQGETLDAIATGTTEGNILQARLQNFPLAALNFPADGIAGYGQVRGVVDQADIAVDISDLSRPEFMGDLALSNPGVGYLGVDNFRGRITYANGTATLVGGNIEQTNSQGQISRYLLTGRYTQGPDPEIAGELEVVQGNLQDVLETAQIFRLTDFGRGLNPPEWIENDLSPEAIEAALATEPTGDPNATLLDQIRRLSEILVSQRIEQEQAEAEPLPPLGDLNGAFTGNVRFNGRLRSGLTAAFDFDGQNWQWGDEFAAERVVARGGYTDGVLNVERIELASGDRQNPMAITAIGDIALLAEDETPRTLQVSVVDVPIAPLQDVARIPVDISGRLNGTAQLTGSLQAPQVRGRLDIDQATVNQREVRSATARFSYNQARLNLISDLLVSDVDQPLALRASLPYVFPFMTVRPESNEYEIRMDVENEGLALINIFTDQIAWQGGDAALNLDITGEWQEAARRPRTINVQGSARFSDAEFALKTLPENLTDVDGVISFRRDRLVVQDLEGRYSEGRVEARGTFPLDPTVRLQTVEPPTATAPAERGAIADVAEANAAAAASRETVSLLDNVNPNGPLFVSLDRVDLELEDLYAGQVNGLVQVTGSAFPGPVLSGELFFTNGQVFLNSGDNSDGATAATGNTATPLPIVIGLSDLDLNLTRNIQVIQPGLFTLGAQGVLRLNGLLNDLEPSGRIDLTSGRVSLLATSLRLDGRDNYAEFEPETGLDPLLNLSLRTIVPEARTSGAGLVNSSPFPRNEVVDQDFEVFSLNQGSVRTVRIFAQVTGYASELTSLEGITFSSSPARSDSEILTLLSGPYIAALESTVGSTGGSGDSFQGLLTLAGSALLTQVQDIIGDALQLSEFSLFPTSPPSGQANDSDFDIGAEIGFNISNSFSASILQILTSSTAPQFNLRYRLSDQFTVRGTTTYEDFRERSGVILEYESRF